MSNNQFDNFSGLHGLSYGGMNTGFDAGNNSGDWFALPLDALVDQYGADITATTYGPDVNGIDVLDVLLSTDQNSSSHQGSATPGLRGGQRDFGNS
jgi:hypothetical protein